MEGEEERRVERTLQESSEREDGREGPGGRAEGAPSSSEKETEEAISKEDSEHEVLKEEEEVEEEVMEEWRGEGDNRPF